MDLALVTLLIASAVLVCQMVLLLSLKNLERNSGDIIQEALNTVGPQIQGVLEKSFESLTNQVMGMKGGVISGISRQFKGAEKDLIAEGINAVSPFPVGDIAAKYLQKYPALQMFLPMLLGQAQGGASNPVGSSSSEFGDQRLVKR